MLVRTSCSAGTSPVASPAMSVATAATPNTRRSSPTSCWRGRLPGGSSDSSQLIPQIASSRPTTAPTTARRTLSVSSCRMTCARPAPSAVRTAISRCRPDARASSAFATLAQAMSSTKVTIARSARSVRTDAVDDLVEERRTVIPRPVFVWGYRRSSSEAILCHFGLRLRDAHAVLEPSEQSKRTAGTVVEPAGERERDPHLGARLPEGQRIETRPA